MDHQQASHAQIQTDGDLLGRFLAGDRDAAFDELARRHGTMVYNVCLRVLGAPHPAEDATQATFLTLAQKATALRGRACVAGWLYRVAWHIARRARQAETLRKAHERDAGTMANQQIESARAWALIKPLLDEELNALPERYRLPLVLHHLEGQTEEAGARLLRWNPGTFSSRLSRGRDLLRDRLRRRGVALGSAALATAISNHAAEAAIPAALAAARLHSGIQGTASVQVMTLTKEALNMLRMARLKLVAMVTAVVLAAGSGLGIGFTRLAGAETGVAGEVSVDARLVKESVTTLEQLKLAITCTNKSGKAVAVQALSNPASFKFSIQENGRATLQYHTQHAILEPAATEALEPQSSARVTLDLTGGMLQPVAVNPRRDGDKPLYGNVYAPTDALPPGTYVLSGTITASCLPGGKFEVPALAFKVLEPPGPSERAVTQEISLRVRPACAVFAAEDPLLFAAEFSSIAKDAYSFKGERVIPGPSFFNEAPGRASIKIIHLASNREIEPPLQARWLSKSRVATPFSILGEARFWISLGAQPQLAPGRYQLSLTLKTGKLELPDQLKAYAQPGKVLDGELTSRPVEFEIGAPADPRIKNP